MTHQELFDAAVRGVVMQGGPCYSEQAAQYEDEFYPAMAGDLGRRSPSGWVLPAELVDARPTWNVYFLHRNGLLPSEFHGQYGLLRSLEGAHDRGFCEFVDRFEGPLPGCDRRFMDAFVCRCEDVAVTYGLTMPDLTGDGERMAA